MPTVAAAGAPATGDASSARSRSDTHHLGEADICDWKEALDLLNSRRVQQCTTVAQPEPDTSEHYSGAVMTMVGGGHGDGCGGALAPRISVVLRSTGLDVSCGPHGAIRVPLVSVFFRQRPVSVGASSTERAWANLFSLATKLWNMYLALCRSGQTLPVPGGAPLLNDVPPTEQNAAHLPHGLPVGSVQGAGVYWLQFHQVVAGFGDTAIASDTGEHAAVQQNCGVDPGFTLLASSSSGATRPAPAESLTPWRLCDSDDCTRIPRSSQSAEADQEVSGDPIDRQDVHPLVLEILAQGGGSGVLPELGAICALPPPGRYVASPTEGAAPHEGVLATHVDGVIPNRLLTPGQMPSAGGNELLAEILSTLPGRPPPLVSFLLPEAEGTLLAAPIGSGSAASEGEWPVAAELHRECPGLVEQSAEADPRAAEDAERGSSGEQSSDGEDREHDGEEVPRDDDGADLARADVGGLPPELRAQGLLLSAAHIDCEGVVQSGCFGAVGKGTLLGAPVAIKRLHNPDREALLLETLLLARLRHPYILQVCGIAEDQGHLFMVTEYCAHGDVYTRVTEADKEAEAGADTELLWKTKLGWLHGVACALHFVHTQGIVHRDVKGTNVFLASEDVPKLGDFGLAVPAVMATLQGPAGTPYYMAPELLDGEHFTPECDVYALGVLLVEVCTAWVPFERLQRSGRSAAAEDWDSSTKARVISGELRAWLPPVLAGCPTPAGLRRLAWGLLQRRPQDRCDLATARDQLLTEMRESYCDNDARAGLRDSETAECEGPWECGEGGLVEAAAGGAP